MGGSRNCFVIGAAVLAMVCITTVRSQTLLLGACPNPPMQQNFSAETLKSLKLFESGRCGKLIVRYQELRGSVSVMVSGTFLGRWYEVERTFVMAEVGWRCISVDYREENGKIRVETVGQAVVRRAMSAQATFTPNTPARIILRGEGSLPTQSTNYVLFTDYENAAVVWSCRNVEPPIPISGLDFLRNLSHTENLWILSRKRTLDPAIKEQIYTFLDTNAITRRSLRPVPQDNCQAAATTP